MKIYTLLEVDEEGNVFNVLTFLNKETASSTFDKIVSEVGVAAQEMVNEDLLCEAAGCIRWAGDEFWSISLYETEAE